MLLLCLMATFASAQVITRGPYLQFNTSNSIIIKWRTDVPSDSKVWYGDYHDNLNTSAINGVVSTEHAVVVTGLNPNTQYYYAIGSSNQQLAGQSDDHYFKTHPLTDSGNPVNIWVLGDAGSKDSLQRGVRDAYYDFNGSDYIDMMLLLGDNAYEEGTDQEYQEAWFEDMYEDRLINSVMWSCYGNHEAGSANSSDESGVYFDIFDFPTNAELGGAPSGTESYFSFDYDNIHVISLNSYDEDREPEGPMLTWLQQDLAVTDKDWIIALIHHPPYSGYGLNNSDTNSRERDMRENALPMLEAAGVDLVLMGHTHAYQRSFLINGHYDISATFDPDVMALDIGDGRIDGDAAYVKAIGGTNDGKGTVYINTGSAGKLSEGHLLAHPVMFHNNSEKQGSLAIKVEGTQMDVSFIDLDSDIDDYFTIVKQIEPPEVSMIYPANDTYFQDIELVEITADAVDENGSISKVEFFVDNFLVGIDYSAPYAAFWTPPAEGSYRLKVVATDNDGNFSSAISIVQVGPINICGMLLGNTDDSEESQFGDVSIGSSDLELTYDNSHQTIGLRYKNLRIPKNSIINSAYIQFTTLSNSNINPCDITIYAEDVDDSESFTSEDFNLSTRSKTDAAVVWSPPNWLDEGDNGSAQKTIDISSVIQEVVFRPGYSAESTISILMDGTGRRRAYSRNSDPLKSAIICLEYIPFCPDSDNDGTCDPIDQCPGIEPGTVCDDNDPSTFNDAIDENCNCVGMVYDCPASMSFIGESCDDGDPYTYNDIWNVDCNCQGTFASMTYACSAINADNNDAEEKENGTVSIYSGDIELVTDGPNQTIGLRFTDLALPFGAVIQYANIQFTSDGTDNQNPCILNIYGEADASPDTFSIVNYDISSRLRTVANVTWSPADWDRSGKDEQAQQTVDIAPVIQEVVNRTGFTDTSAIVILIDGIGKRTAESFDGDDEESAVLCVDYYIDGPPGGGPGLTGGDPASTIVQNEKPNIGNNTFNNFKIFPNPANDRLHLSFHSVDAVDAPLLIRDIRGKVVYSELVETLKGGNHFVINKLGLPAGVYVVQMLLDGELESVRLVVF